MTEILDMLQAEFGDKGTVSRCYDPIVYMQSGNFTPKFPFILLSYKSSLYSNSKLYPCTSTFEIYFIDNKKKADELLDLMQVVYDFFNDNVVLTINEYGNVAAGHKMIYQEQGLHAESNEHIIYVQRYNLLIP
jgi:hypothetical protein